MQIAHWKYLCPVKIITQPLIFSISYATNAFSAALGNFIDTKYSLGNK
jgi:hypothetical protein